MIKIPELDIEVEDIGEFNDRASEILEDFCMELDKKPGMSRPADPEVDSFLDETNFSHIWIGEPAGETNSLLDTHIHFRGPNSHCKACEDEKSGIKHIKAQRHTCNKKI